MRRIFLLVLVICSFCRAGFCSSARYVSLAPSATEILFALGLDENIVGVSSFCNYPPQAKNKQIVGSFSAPNIEKIISLKPDIVFCAGLEQAPAAAQLKKLGINVVAREPKNIKELLDSIREIGGLTGNRETADGLVGRMTRTIEKIKARCANVPQEQRPLVFVEYWNNPLMTAGPGSFIDELITLAGGRNAAFDAPRPYCNFSPEQVLNRDPDCIILAYMLGDDAGGAVGRRLGWSKLKAVKNHRVYDDIDPDLLLRPGPRIAEGLEELHKRLYPRS